MEWGVGKPTENTMTAKPYWNGGRRHRRRERLAIIGIHLRWGGARLRGPPTQQWGSGDVSYVIRPKSMVVAGQELLWAFERA